MAQQKNRQEGLTRGIRSVLLLLAAPLAVEASDLSQIATYSQHYSWRRGVQEEATEQVVYFLGEDAARLDLGGVSYYIDLERKELTEVSHGVGRYRVWPVPLDLFEVALARFSRGLPPDQAEDPALLRQAEEGLQQTRAAARPEDAQIQRTGERRTIAGYDTHATLVRAGTENELDYVAMTIWAADELEELVEGTAFTELEANRMGLSFHTEWLADVYLDLEGLPIRIEAVVQFAGKRTAYTRTLVSLEQREDSRREMIFEPQHYTREDSQ